jgi:hypothetical protein
LSSSLNDQPVATPRWDGSRVTFEVRDGETLVRCAISRAALLDIAERSHLRPAEMMDCFTRSRRRIEVVALAKFRRRSGPDSGLVNIWSDDVEAAQGAG